MYEQFSTIVNTNMHMIVESIVQHAAISCRYGVTDIFISDNGTEFVNKIARELNTQAGCTHRITSPYYPQANGLVERLN